MGIVVRSLSNPRSDLMVFYGNLPTRTSALPISNAGSHHPRHGMVISDLGGMAKVSSKRLDARASGADSSADVDPSCRTHENNDDGIARAMMNISDYLVDWAEQVRALTAMQRDSRMQQKLVALTDECCRIT